MQDDTDLPPALRDALEADPTGALARVRARQPKAGAHLFALMWAWFLGLMGREPPRRDTGEFTRVAYRRRGHRVYVQDLQSDEQVCVRADSTPEARQFCAALAFGARAAPKASARDVASAAMELVNEARAARGD